MNELHPFSRYGLAFLMFKQNIQNAKDLNLDSILKYIDDGNNHFRVKAKNSLNEDVIEYEFTNLQKGDPKRGIYLSPCIITDDKKASNTWIAVQGLKQTLIQKKNELAGNANEEESKQQLNKFLFETKDKITMGLAPVAGEINNGTKSKKNYQGSIAEKIFCAVTNTTPVKPYLAYKKPSSKGINYVPTAIIPDLNLEDLKVFIEFYDLMINRTIDQNQLLRKKVYRKEGKKPEYSRPPIYDGNFPYAPKSSALGVVGLLGAIGRWSKEANIIEKGQRILESLKEQNLYITQYGKAQSVTVNHYIIDLAKENKLSDIVFAIQKSKIYHSFDERDPKDAKGIKSKQELFTLLSSRFLQFFDKPSFKDFLSVRAEYSDILIELFNTLFIKQLNMRKEIVHSVRALGLWLNYIAYKVGKQEAKNPNDKEEVNKNKAKLLVEFESSIFGSRKPAEMLNVIVRAGRLSGADAPADDVFQEAVLTEEININDAKSMLMAYARIRNRFEQTNNRDTNTNNEGEADADTPSDLDVTE